MVELRLLELNDSQNAVVSDLLKYISHVELLW